MGLMIAVVRKIVAGDRAIRDGAWASRTQSSMDLFGATMGMVGLGQIGKAFARRAAAFGMRLLVHTRSPDPVFAGQFGVQYAPLDDVLAQADVVGLFASLDNSSRHMIGARELALMKPCAYFLNIARGELVDEAALLDALRTARIAGAGIDVFEQEPLLDSEFVRTRECGADSASGRTHLRGQDRGRGPSRTQRAAGARRTRATRCGQSASVGNGAMSERKPLRSAAWFSRQDKNGFYYRSWLKNRGIPQDQFDGRPVIGICNTWSELTPCNTHFKTLADHVRWGVLEAGGFPLEFPVMSLGETLLRPTAMLYRNLASMDVEESIRAHPLDGVVLLMGCDKTTPALLMGAASVDVPAIGISAGPMLRGVYQGRYIGSGTNTISMSEQLRGGEITLSQYHEAEACMHRSHGTCMTMGTASTMACLVEALGMSLPGNAAIPAVDARRNLLARESGRRIVDLVKDDVVMSRIVTRQALENAVRVNAAIGGSTNAVIHLIALARRLGLPVHPR